MKTRKREKSVFSTLLKVFSIALALSASVFALPQGAYAENHTCSDANNCSAFTIELYRCVSEGSCTSTSIATFAKNIAKGKANSYLIGSDTKVAEGDLIVVAIKFTPATYQGVYPQTVVDTVTYNTDYFETVKKTNKFYSYTITEQLPYYYDEDEERNVANYDNTLTNQNAGAVVQQIYAKSGVTDRIDKTAYLGFFVLNTINAPSGGQATIGFNDATPTNMVLSGPVSGVETKFPYKKTDTVLNFAGESSSTDATLSSLSVKNSDNTVTYPLTPSVAPNPYATPRNTFSTKVPSSVSTINIHATANDNNAQDIRLFTGEKTDTEVENDTDASKSIVTGSSIPIVGIGTKAVTTGENKFTVAVTSQSGNVQNEIVSVYKLSSNADLSDLVVAGQAFDNNETFQASDTTYSISNVPYATKSMSITAAAAHANATLTGDGTWAFSPDTTAAQTYTRNIVVTPEECNYTTGHTEVVQGATCTTKTYTITVNREAASTDANLKSLSASYVHTTGSSATTDQLITSSSAGQTFTLKDGTNNESVPYAADSVSFTATANQAKAKGMTIKVNNAAATPISTSGSPISGSATCALNVGDNTCVIEVTAEDGAHKQTYTVNAHRRSNDASLKTLTVSATPNPSGNALSPAFPSSSNDTYGYQYNEKAGSYVISATVNDTDKTASVVMTRSGVQKSTTGNTISESYTPSGSRTTADVVTITVTAEDGNTRTYTINLTREASSDASLSEIQITTTNGTTPTTKTITPTANTYNYTIDVDPDVNTISNVTATATSSHAMVNASDITYTSALAFGSGNVITIKGTPESGNQSQYNITVNRKKYNIAGATKIEVLYGSSSTWEEVSGVSPNADGTFNLYTQANPLPFATDNMSIRVTKANEEASVSGDGTNLPLVANQNNAKVVTVTAQDNSATRTYTFNVFRQGNPNTDITDLKVKNVYAPVQAADEGNKKVYTLSVPFSVTSVTEAEVAVTTADPYANVTKSGTLNLNAGTAADYNFTVTSQGGNTQDYVIRITRQQNTDSGASKIDLRLTDESSATRTWVPGTSETTHTFSIPYNKSTYFLEAAIPEGARLSQETGYVDSDDELTIDSSGTSIHKIKVISQDGNSETEYTITVTREKSSDNTLANLYLNYINNGEAVINQQIDGFQANKTTYYLTVPGTTTEMRVGAELADKRGTFTSTNTNADYDSGNVSLTYDLNTITFTAKAENGAEQTYYINVTRQRKTNQYIQSILINGNDLSTYLPSGVAYDGARAGGTYEYTLTNFPNSTSSITIDAIMVDAPTATEPGASASLVSNNQALPQTVGIKTIHYGGAANLDNQITIKGLAHDGTTYQNYILHIYRDPSNDPSVSNDADAVQIYWDGSWHNATWNGPSLAYEITVPNSVNSVKGVDVGGNFQAKPMAAPVNGAAGTVTYAAEKTLVTDDENTGNINSYSFTITAEDGTTPKSYNVKITKEKSDNSDLASIAVNDAYGTSIGSFNPSFAADKYAYTVTVGKDVDEIWIAANTAEGHANISGTGRQVIDGVDDVFTVTVIPENGDTSKKKEYTLTIVREKSDDATLSEFTVTDLNDNVYTMTPVFNSADSTTVYEVTIPGDQDRVKLSYVGSTNLADGVTQTIAYTETPDESTNIYNIPTGSNRTLGVKVTAENGTAEKTYRVKVNRTPRSEAGLNSLTYSYNNGTAGNVDLSRCVENPTGTFNCDLGTQVNSGPTTVTFGAQATDTQASIGGDIGEAKAIATGRNSYQITVTAEDGSTQQIYNISLIKLPSEESKLTNITVIGHSISKLTDTEYEVTVGEDDTSFSSSNLKVTPASNKSTIDYGDPISLTAGADNLYRIVVTPESCKDEYADLVSDGLVKCTEKITTYTINVDRPLSSNNKLADLEVDEDTRMSPSFTVSGRDYAITIPYGGTQFDITAIPEKDTSIVTDNVGCTFSVSNSNTCRVHYNDLTNGVYTITVTPQSGTNPRIINFTVSIAQSSDNTLASLKVLDKDGAQIALTPSFDPAEGDYTIPDITNDVTELIVQARENNSDATYRYIYQNNEVCGEASSCRINIDPSRTMQTIKVEVTPADGSAAKVYRIDFNIKKDNDADLASLSVTAPGTLSPEFAADTINYTVTGLTYENTTGPVTLKFKTSDPDAKISINAGAEQTSGTVEWTTDLNFSTTDKNAQTITTVVRVIAEDNTTKTYTITATRAAALASTDATLSSLEVTDETLDPGFTAEGTEYDLGEIDYQKRSLEFKIGPNNEEAKVFVNGSEVEINGGIATTAINAPLINDEQTVTIRVLAGDNVTDKTYTVKFHKQGDNDATLASLTFTNGTLTPAFDPAEEVYTLTLGEGQTTSITAVPAGQNATMTFGSTGNMKSLGSGETMGVTGLTETQNVRKLVIAAEDGTVKTITINIIRRTGDDKITSLEYGHEIHDGYIWSVADRDIGSSDSEYQSNISGTMTVALLKSQLDNDPTQLYIYAPKRDASGNIIMDSNNMPTHNDTALADTDTIGTGAKVVLMIDDVIKDSDIVVIRGDTDGDGMITMNDYSLIQDTFMEYDDYGNPIGLTSQPFLNAANVDMDANAFITMNDFSLVQDHFMEYDDLGNSILIDYRSMLNPSGGASSGG